MVTFEGYERRIEKINATLKEYGIASLEEAKEICTKKGVDVEAIVKGIQPIAFENAVWAYTVGAAIAFKAGAKTAAEAAEKIGIGLQSFCIPGSVADQRAVGLGHGNLGAMLLREETKCFCLLAGHESFAAAEGAIAGDASDHVVSFLRANDLVLFNAVFLEILDLYMAAVANLAYKMSCFNNLGVFYKILDFCDSGIELALFGFCFVIFAVFGKVTKASCFLDLLGYFLFPDGLEIFQFLLKLVKALLTHFESVFVTHYCLPSDIL